MSGNPVVTALEQALSGVTAGRVWIGFSGGLDSSVLLDAALRATDQPVSAIHINHHLHADSDLWAAHCTTVCARLGVKCQIHDVRVAERGSLEQAARDARFAVFTSLLSQHDVLLLGHHADDQSETILFRLLRGSSARPGGMAACRSLGAGTLLRPLLDLPRQTLEAYAELHGLRWLEDPSNADTAHDRNFLRHRVLPGLRERWPEAVANIVRSATGQARDAALLERLLDRELQQTARGGTLLVERLQQFDDPRRLLRHWLQRHGIHGTRDRALEEFLRQLDEADAAPALRMEEGIWLRGYAGWLHLTRDVPVTDGWERSLVVDGTRSEVQLRLPHGRLGVHRRAGRPRLGEGAYTVKPRAGGERLRSSAGQSRAVKQLLQEAAVPPWRRRGYPLIYAGAELVAVPGVCVAPTVHRDGGWELEWHPADAIT